MAKYIAVYGAGGHGRVVVDILQQLVAAGENILIAGYIDDAPLLYGQKLNGVPVLGGADCLRNPDFDAIVPAVGNNLIRKDVYNEIKTHNITLFSAVHPRAIVSDSAHLGEGCVLAAGVIVNPECIIHDNVILNTGCTIDHHNLINAHAHIAPGANLGGDVVIGTGAMVGIGATVMPGRAVGEWSVVGASACVVHPVADNQVVVGVPAAPVRKKG